MGIDIYVKKNCGYCKQAESLLKKRKVKFKRIDVTNDETEEAEMIIRSKGCTAVPQIFIGDKYVGGANDLARLPISEFKALLKK